MKTRTRFHLNQLIAALGSFLACATLSFAQDTAFTYQGRLLQGGQPANGLYDLRFSLFASSNEVTSRFNVVSAAPVAVNNGLFTVSLDFGADPFQILSSPLLEIGVRTNGTATPYQVLSPRQPISSAPWAIRAITAGAADTMSGDLTLQNLNRLNFGGSMRQMVNFFNTVYGMGVQTDTLYQRSDGGFAWFQDGIHNNGANNPGTGGSVLMTLNPSGHLGLNTNNAVLAALVVNDQVNLNAAIFGNRHPIALSQSWPLIGFNSYYSGSNGINTIYTGGGSSSNYAAQISLDPFSGNLYFSTTAGSAASHVPVNSSTRMAILNNGNVGIGTTSPGGKLEINTGNGSVQITSDLVPAINVTGGTIPGTMRFRNALEVWPSQGQARAGYVDVRDTNNTATIILRGNGTATVKVLEITGGADIAEPFQMSDEQEIPAGAVVIIDDKNPGRLRLSDRAYDTRVAGIVSGANGINPGLALHQKGALDGGRNVALSGRVYALADASEGAIKPGDLLTTAERPGHAMAVRDFSRVQGAILGKAMSRLDAGQGLVLVLVTLQ